MKKIIAVLSFGLVSLPFAGHSQTVNGYYKNDGTYVESYNRTEANDTKEDNYSTSGNTNPYTGEKGYKSAW